MATTDAPVPTTPGNNRDLLQEISNQQRAVATGGKVPSPAQQEKKLAKAAEPTKAAATEK